MLSIDGLIIRQNKDEIDAIDDVFLVMEQHPALERPQSWHLRASTRLSKLFSASQ